MFKKQKTYKRDTDGHMIYIKSGKVADWCDCADCEVSKQEKRNAEYEAYYWKYLSRECDTYGPPAA